MQIIQGTTQFHIDRPSAVAIGKFDGIHMGHRRLLEQLIHRKSMGALAVVFTFDPSPAVFFAGKTLPELTTKEEKRAYFERLGVDVLIEYPLNQESAGIDPTLFVRRMLQEQMQAKYIIAGEDVSFGAGGKGDAKLLHALSKECGYEMELIDKVCIDGITVSSTKIRELVADGNMELVRRMLGEAYPVTGLIRHGKHLGRTIGMPTVNLLPEKGKLLPPNGVYYSEVELGDQVYQGITNIGYKPTVTDEQVMGVETYLYDFAQDVYGKFITVRLLSFKRPEMRFAGVEELKKQMASDIAQGRYYHKEHQAWRSGT
ncbi:MAG: bifunctional riboflavin kinase/FAD synthetase [Lachnospiraceae bacterium]|nr:bifunctional riboflavin kinase/FAD synthetase [Lachnospiraceae bacterium]